MRLFLALIALVLLAIIVTNDVRGGSGPLLVDAAAPLKCFEAHPCTRINCDRRIA